MEENKSLEISLFETLTDRSKELGGEIGELTIDQFIENDFLKDIPFFSIFYKSLKTVQGLREALFAMKVYKFIKEFNQIRQKDKDSFLKQDKKEKIKIGQTLIIILEKIDELDKTQIIANLFAAYIKSELTKSEFIQLCSIVQNIYLEHLLLFSKMKRYDELSIDIQSNLSSCGLMTPIVNDLKSMYGDSVIIENNTYTIVYVVSKIGVKMRKHAFETNNENHTDRSI